MTSYFPQQSKVPALCKQNDVLDLYLFGSAVKNNMTTSSDLDFCVRFLTNDPKKLTDSYFKLLSSLEDLTGKKVDLIMENQIQNPYLLQEITTTKTLIYAAPGA